MSRDDAYLLDIVLAAREIRELVSAIDIDPLLATLEPIVPPEAGD